MSDLEKASEKFHGAISFTMTAYNFYLSNLPSEEEISVGVVTINHVPFQNKHHVDAYANELSWAFFVRVEAAFDALCGRLKLGKKEALEVINRADEITCEEKRLYRSANELRNVLHHGDGDHTLLKRRPEELRVTDGTEPIITPNEMYLYASLFQKAGGVLLKAASAAA